MKKVERKSESGPRIDATRALRKKAESVAVKASTESAKRTKSAMTSGFDESGKSASVMIEPPMSAMTRKVRP